MKNIMLREVMAVIVTFVLLGGSLYVILVGGYSEGTQNWAFSMVGGIVVCWLNVDLSGRVPSTSPARRRKRRVSKPE